MIAPRKSHPSILPAACVLFMAIPAVSEATTTIPLSQTRRFDNSSVNSGTSATLGAGDSSSTSTIYIFTVNYDLSAYLTEIASATSITFSIGVTGVLSGGADVSLFALDTDTSTANSAQYTGSGSVVGTYLANTITNGQTLTFDVTSYVKADALDAGSLMSFRIQSQHLGVGNDGNGDANLVQFGTPASNNATLTVVPEPSAAILGMIGSVFLLRRRR